MSNTLQDQVRSWLDTHGYRFELTVARLFQEAGFTITISDYAADGTTEPREIDVIAKHTSLLTTVHPFELTFVCECKYSKRKPWVVFKSTANDDITKMAEYLYRFATKGGHLALLEMSAGGHVTSDMSLFRLPTSMGHGVRVALEETKSDLAYRTITKVCDGAAALIAEKEKQPDSYSIMFPVIFLQGQIFECQIDEKMDITLKNVDRSTILWRRPTTQSSLVPVEIVSEAAIPAFIEEKFAQCERTRPIIESGLPKSRDAALISLAAASF